MSNGRHIDSMNIYRAAVSIHVHQVARADAAAKRAELRIAINAANWGASEETMKTIEVKIAENETERSSGKCFLEATRVDVTSPITWLPGGPVEDAIYQGSVLFFTNSPVLRDVVERALKEYGDRNEMNIGSCSMNR